MAEILKLNQGVEEGLKDLLKTLLKSGKVRAVFTLAKIDEGDGVTCLLISNPDAIDSAVPLYPMMPANAGKVLSRLTMVEHAEGPVAAVIRPCELRAFIELMKRSQGSLDNILLISSTCGGVYPLQMAVGDEIQAKLTDYWEAIKKADIPADLRPSCSTCTSFVPSSADVVIDLIGNSDIDSKCRLHLNSDKAKEMLSDIQGERTSTDTGSGLTEQLSEKRQAQKDKMVSETQPFDMEKVFEKCIGCRACSKVCPACYCHLCFFESKEGDASQYLDAGKLDRQGYAHVLPNKMYYHLIRSFHVSISCVECGQCADVCPVNIPLSVLAAKTGDAVHLAYDYIPGKSTEEMIPTTNFIPEEFAGVQ